MRIIAMRPEPPGSGRVIAKFDWSATDDIRMLNWTLKTTADGHHRVFAPFVKDGPGPYARGEIGNQAATLSLRLAAKLTELALAAFHETTRQNADEHAAA